jgi:protein-disulfide isomerase
LDERKEQLMIIRSRTLPIVFAFMLCLAATPMRAEMQRSDVEQIIKDYLDAHPEAVERIVKDYFAKNPDAITAAFAEIIKRRMANSPAASRKEAPDSQKIVAAIQDSAKQLQESSHQLTIGNLQGDVTVVEFFDYNCGYCKKALGDTLTLLQDDPKLKIVLKELPILSPGSIEAAKVSIAARIQDPSGQKPFELHRRLLSGSGFVDKSAAMAVAKDVGLDVERIERDMSGEEVRLTLEESSNLARQVGIRGTPGYVVGTTVVPGAVGAAGLKERIAALRAKPAQ